MSRANASPKVSCVCVTRKKPDKLARAIACFRAQTYVNRELVVLAEDDDEGTLAMLEGCRDDARVRVHVVSCSPKRPLGELRNHAIELCHGEYFCQWDDDDWFHVDRIAVQVAAVTRAFQPATILTNWLMFEVRSEQAYFSQLRLWEGSILCRKDVLEDGLKYPSMSRMEDTVFVNALVETKGVLPLIAPTLYIYEIHRQNTWSERHFEAIFAASQRLSASTSALVARIMAGALSVAEASRLLDSPDVLREIRYIPAASRQTRAEVDAYLADMSGVGASVLG